MAVYEVLDVMDRCDTMPNIRWCIQMARSLYFGERASGFEVTENALSDQHHDARIKCLLILKQMQL